MPSLDNRFWDFLPEAADAGWMDGNSAILVPLGSQDASHGDKLLLLIFQLLLMIRLLLLLMMMLLMMMVMMMMMMMRKIRDLVVKSCKM